jgi:polysaccharide deacetylase 2 family uncharacterized protein YibQ
MANQRANGGSRRRDALGIPPVTPEEAAVPSEKHAVIDRKHHQIALACFIVLGSLLALVLVFWQPGTEGRAVANIAAPEAVPESATTPEIVEPIDFQAKALELPLFEPDPVAAPIPEEPVWRKNAVKVAGTGNAPRLAIIIDDMGPDRHAVKRASRIKGPLTFAFLPYAQFLPRLTQYAHDHGHELMVHMPMEPAGHNADPGPNALLLDLDPAELKRRIAWNLDRFDGFVGTNNHMGSLYTTNEPAMRLVLEEVQKRGLLYVDSRTTKETVGERVSKELGIPTLARDVFLDNEEDEDAIREQLRMAVSIARKYGSAIAIGHPYKETLSVLEKDLPDYQRQGLVLVPVSALLKHKATIQTAEQGQNTAGH